MLPAITTLTDKKYAKLPHAPSNSARGNIILPRGGGAIYTTLNVFAL